jgi:DNA-directed RNA polymerase specialized sigma24 family protein
LRAARRPHAAGQTLQAKNIPDATAATAEQQLEQELLRAERHAALREAFADLPPDRQRLLALLIEDPPVPYDKISAELGIPVGSIDPDRGRCLDKLRRRRNPSSRERGTEGLCLGAASLISGHLRGIGSRTGNLEGS